MRKELLGLALLAATLSDQYAQGESNIPFTDSGRDFNFDHTKYQSFDKKTKRIGNNKKHKKRRK